MSRKNSPVPKKVVKHHGPKSDHPEPERGSLAWKIRQKRRAEGLNAEELGEKIGVSGVSISKIETGRTKISESTMWTIIKIVKALNTDFGEPAIKGHLETWLPRIYEALEIADNGPHDFGEAKPAAEKVGTKR